MSSKRRIRRKSCGNKIKFKDQAGAVAALISLRHKKGDICHSYRCRFCGHWHIGHA